MSTSTGTTPAADEQSGDTEHTRDHPTDLKYVKIALLLGVITAFEVGTYFIEDASTTLLVALLFPMMIAKFLIVTAYFMHLRYDNPLFRRVFFFGLVLAVSVFVVALFAFEFFSTDYLKFLR